MPERSYRQFCALARALDVIGDRWSMLIVRNLLLGPRTWSQLVDTLPGMAKNLLASRLVSLENNGVIAHEGAQYLLTPRGAELESALFAIADWGEKHFMGPARSGEAVRLRYLMTSIRRKLRPSPQSATLQLWVDEEPFFVELGPRPQLTQGEGEADAVLHCRLESLKSILLGGDSLAIQIADERVQLRGDPAVVEAARQSLSGPMVR